MPSRPEKFTDLPKQRVDVFWSEIGLGKAMTSPSRFQSRAEEQTLGMRLGWDWNELVIKFKMATKSEEDAHWGQLIFTHDSKPPVLISKELVRLGRKEGENVLDCIY